MVQLDGYNTYREANMTINGTSYTVKFSISKDKQEHMYFIINNQDRSNARVNLNPKNFDVYKELKEEDFEIEILSTIEQDVINKVIRFK